MNVKGTAFLAREATMIAAHGEGVWRDYLRTYAEGEPLFRARIAPEGARHPEPHRIRGFSQGDPDILYRFRID